MRNQPLYIVWTPALEVGVPILDEQHHGIAATINSLFYFIQQGWGLAGLTPTLKLMRQYADFHAKTEEGVLQAAGYADLTEYRLRHKKFMDETPIALATALEERDPDVLLRFLRTWWRTHIEQEHPDYAACFAAAGAIVGRG